MVRQAHHRLEKLINRRADYRPPVSVPLLVPFRIHPLEFTATIPVAALRVASPCSPHILVLRAIEAITYNLEKRRSRMISWAVERADFGDALVVGF
jgi:hypothetical protein